MRIGSRAAAGLAVLGIALALGACATPGRVALTREVVASAYNSLPGQTSGDPSLGAWGDRLVPGMKAIAVSRDLLDRGLVRGTRVRIEGLPGEYVVLDKMAARWKDHIDVYMGEDVAAARAWGRRTVRIHWSASPPGP